MSWTRFAEFGNSSRAVERSQTRETVQEPVQAGDIGVPDEDLGVCADRGVQLRVCDQGREEFCEGAPADGADDGGDGGV